MKKILWIMSIAPLAVTLIVLPFMPETTPAHYNIAWEIDRWGTKYELLILPVMTILFTLIIYLIIINIEKSDKSRKKMSEASESTIKGLILMGISLALVFGIMQLIFIYTSYTSKGAVGFAVANCFRAILLDI